MDNCRKAREVIWQEIIRAGGAAVMAEALGIHFTHLYQWRRRKNSFSEACVTRLRALLPRIKDATWGAALAPLAPVESVESVEPEAP